MKIAVVYTSKTGNTEELARIIYQFILEKRMNVHLFRIEQFSHKEIRDFDAVVIGTYTWGNGDIPLEMQELYHAFETQEVKHVITGVAGTGDSGYARFCGAVDEFRDMLYVRTTLAVTLKVEITPQLKDHDRCENFVKLILAALNRKILIEV